MYTHIFTQICVEMPVWVYKVGQGLLSLLLFSSDLSHTLKYGLNSDDFGQVTTHSAGKREEGTERIQHE